MMSKVVVSCALVLSSLLALCWYPLSVISKTHLVDTQILFYAFASAALLSLPFLFKQASRWRPHAPLLVCFAIISSLANTLLQYSLLAGDSFVVISVFCITLSCLLFFFKTESNMTATLFIALSIVVAAIMMLFLFGGGMKYHWTEWGAVIIALLFFGLLRLEQHSKVIPLGSKLAASLLGSTWLVGMITIFSERFSSYMQDNAVGFSVIYGSLFMMPIMAAVLYVLSIKRSGYVWLWLSLLLSVNLVDRFLGSEGTSLVSVSLLIGLLAFAIFLQIFRSGASHS